MVSVGDGGIIASVEPPHALARKPLVVLVAAKAEHRPVDRTQCVELRPCRIDRLADEVRLDLHGMRRGLETDDRRAAVQAGPEVARDRSRIGRSHDRPMAGALARERSREELLPDPG